MLQGRMRLYRGDWGRFAAFHPILCGLFEQERTSLHRIRAGHTRFWYGGVFVSEGHPDSMDENLCYNMPGYVL